MDKDFYSLDFSSILTLRQPDGYIGPDSYSLNGFSKDKNPENYEFFFIFF